MDSKTHIEKGHRALCNDHIMALTEDPYGTRTKLHIRSLDHG